MKGIILAGGKGTRLLPATRVLNKHMIPILNVPMIEYPLKTLIGIGCTDIMVISGGNHIGGIAEYLGDGSEYGVNLTYRVQKDAGGIAQALGLAEGFVSDGRVAVILGDNIFSDDSAQIRDAVGLSGVDSAHIFTSHVFRPERFGVVHQDENGKFHIEEKPKEPKSNEAVTGLYIYPRSVFDVIKTLKPSARGELEITDVNNYFINEGNMIATKLSCFWSDAGTPESLAEVTNYFYERNKTK